MADVTNRMRNHDADRKWTTDNAKRIDAIEGQVRDQTNQAMEYTRSKCLELDRLLRAELDATIPSLIAAKETKVVSLVGFVEARTKALEDSIQKLAGPPEVDGANPRGHYAGKFSERIDALELLVKAHQSQTE